MFHRPAIDFVLRTEGLPFDGASISSPKKLRGQLLRRFMETRQLFFAEGHGMRLTRQVQSFCQPLALLAPLVDMQGLGLPRMPTPRILDAFHSAMLRCLMTDIGGLASYRKLPYWLGWALLSRVVDVVYVPIGRRAGKHTAGLTTLRISPMVGHRRLGARTSKVKECPRLPLYVSD